MRSVERQLIKINLESLYAQLREAKTPSKLMFDIGNRVVHLTANCFKERIDERSASENSFFQNSEYLKSE